MTRIAVLSTNAGRANQELEFDRNRKLGGYGAVVTWKGRTEEIRGGERDTTNQRIEVTAACVALETIDEGHVVTVYSDSSYLVNCMRRGWHETWWDNGWLNNLGKPVANRDLWERLLRAVRRHREVRWRKVKGHQKSGGPHKTGNDRADELALAAKKKAGTDRGSGPTPPRRTGGTRTRRKASAADAAPLLTGAARPPRSVRSAKRPATMSPIPADYATRSYAFFFRRSQGPAGAG